MSIPGLISQRRGALIFAVLLTCAVTATACSNGSSSSTSTTSSSSSAKSLLAQGLAAQKAGNFSLASSYYHQAVAADPTDAGHIAAVAYYDLGVIEQQAKNTDGAIAYYKNTIALYPQYQPAIFNLAIDYTPKNPTKALELYNQLLVYNPTDANGLFNSGLLAYQLGNPTLGVQRIKQAIAITPSLATRVPANVNLNQ